jgi:hypothetical protein
MQKVHTGKSIQDFRKKPQAFGSDRRQVNNVKGEHMADYAPAHPLQSPVIPLSKSSLITCFDIPEIGGTFLKANADMYAKLNHDPDRNSMRSNQDAIDYRIPG